MGSRPFYVNGMIGNFVEGDVVRCDLAWNQKPREYKVIKCCTPTWWRKGLQWIGFNMHIGHVKLEELERNTSSSL